MRSDLLYVCLMIMSATLQSCTTSLVDVEVTAAVVPTTATASI